MSEMLDVTEFRLPRAVLLELLESAFRSGTHHNRGGLYQADPKAYARGIIADLTKEPKP